MHVPSKSGILTSLRIDMDTKSAASLVIDLLSALNENDVMLPSVPTNKM